MLGSKPVGKWRAYGSARTLLLRLPSQLLLCGLIALGSSAFLSRTAMCQTTPPKPDQAAQPQPDKSTQSKPDQPAQSKRHKKAKPQVAPVELPPPQPAVAPNLLDQPALPATVTANNNELTVKADNSSLSQILHQVSSAMGMKLDGLGGDERVFGSFGPGAPREVLTALLDGTSYNVMMVGDLPNGAPRELLLSHRGAEGATPPPSANANANNQNQPQPGDQDNPDDSASSDDSDDSPPMQYTPPSITPAEPPPPGAPSENPPSEAPPRPIPQMQSAPQ
jgi:hypothetical protein